jgi:hypothetical protein
MLTDRLEFNPEKVHMKKLYRIGQWYLPGIPFLISLLFFSAGLHAQQLNIDSFAVFGGNGLCPGGQGQTHCLSPGCSVQIGSSSSILGGSVGSFRLVTTSSSVSITGNIFSGGSVQLGNSNTVTGRITSANSPVTNGTILNIGSKANIGGNIDVNGNIVVSGGSIQGEVTHSSGTTYSGPTPAGGNSTGPPHLPIMPVMPSITTFPAVGVTKITGSQNITPGAYGQLALSGNQTITLSGPGIYVFSSIQNSGATNTFSFDFKNSPSGNFYIYVYGDVNLNKCAATMVNGGSATRIYSETHGTGLSSADGTCSWNIANGSPSGPASKWLGSVWAPYAAIYIGSGSGSSNITGTLWSGTQVNIQSNVTLNFAPFLFCSTPNANAGPDQQLSCSVPTVQLGGSSTTPNAQFNWTAINGGSIV